MRDIRSLGLGALVVVVVGWGQVSLAGAQGEVTAPAARAFSLDTSRLIARRDSFVALSPSGVVGFMRQSVARSATGSVRYVEDVEIPDVYEGMTIVRLGADGAVSTVQQSGTAGGLELILDLTFAADRVRGLGTLPTASGVKLTRVDTAMVAGTVDVNALGALLPAVRWATESRGEWPAFHLARGGAESIQIDVLGRETVEVVGGRFDAWKVRVREGQNVTQYHVAAVAPWRILRIETAGAPFVFSFAK
jgi:hypothetical protein